MQGPQGRLPRELVTTRREVSPPATLLCGPARFPPCWGEAGPFASDWNYFFGLFDLDYKARFVLVCTVTL